MVSLQEALPKGVAAVVDNEKVDLLVKFLLSAFSELESALTHG